MNFKDHFNHMDKQLDKIYDSTYGVIESLKTTLYLLENFEDKYHLYGPKKDKENRYVDEMCIDIRVITDYVQKALCDANSIKTEVLS